MYVSRLGLNDRDKCEFVKHNESQTFSDKIWVIFIQKCYAKPIKIMEEDIE